MRATFLLLDLLTVSKGVEMSDEKVPSKEKIAHIMTVIEPTPSFAQWRKMHKKTVSRLEEKYDVPFREILKECGKNRDPKPPRPPRSD